MRVRMLTTMFGRLTRFIGEECELPDEVAQRYIDDGLAKRVAAPPRVPRTAAESAARRAPETAARTHKPSTRSSVR